MSYDSIGRFDGRSSRLLTSGPMDGPFWTEGVTVNFVGVHVQDRRETIFEGPCSIWDQGISGMGPVLH